MPSPGRSRTTWTFLPASVMCGPGRRWPAGFRCSLQAWLEEVDLMDRLGDLVLHSHQHRQPHLHRQPHPHPGSQQELARQQEPRLLGSLD